MAILKIPQSVFDAGKPLEPDWYKAKCVGVEVKPSSDKGSTNFIPTFELEGMDGRTVKLYINSKFPRLAPALTVAATGKALDPQNSDVDTDEWVGKKVQLKLVNDVYNGNVTSKIDDFAPYEKDMTPGF